MTLPPLTPQEVSHLLYLQTGTRQVSIHGLIIFANIVQQFVIHKLEGLNDDIRGSVEAETRPNE